MEGAIQILLDFVEGRMTAREFEQLLYTNSDVESLLRDQALWWGDTYINTNPYDYTLALDYGDLGQVVTAQGAIALFLERKGIAFKQGTEQSDLYSLILDAMPRWALLDPGWVQRHLLPEAQSLEGAQLLSWLKEKLRSVLRYHREPPRWLQNPDWPVGEDGPMYFLGQIDLDDCELFHDNAAAYLFLDTKTGKTRSIIQVY